MLCLLSLLAGGPLHAQSPRVLIETSHGDLLVELYADKAPQTVAQFLAYAQADFYDGLIFHRVIPDFMIQTGGYDVLMVEREPTRGPIRNEADNGLLNERGTLAMARTRDPHSANAQFFINLKHNEHLDHRHSESSRGWGYAVFGRVVQGMDVVDRIAALPTRVRSGHPNVPVEPVIIHDIRRLDPDTAPAAQP